MPAPSGFQFQESDLVFLQHTFQLRLATIDHLAELSARSYKQTQKRVAALEERKFLRLVQKRPHKHVYAIGKAAVPLLIEQGYAPKELSEKRLRENELKELGIKHAVFVADIHVRLLQLTKTASLQLANWVEGPTLWDRVTMSNNVEVPVRPDALFTIAAPDGKWRSHFFLEADRGTMAHSRMREKIAGYIAYFHQRLHLKKYEGMKVFRVLTATITGGRAEELAKEYATIMRPDWLAAYPVTAFPDITLERLMPEMERSKT
jgi:hypothetical protein